MLKPLKRLLSYLKPYIGYLIVALLFAVVSVSMMLYVPILVGDAVDNIIGPNNVNFDIILKISIKIIICVVIYGVTQWLMNLFINILSNRSIQKIREDAFNKIQHVSIKYIDQNSKGDIISRIVNDIDNISTGLLQGFTQLFTGIVTIVGTIVFMFTINISLAIVVIVLTPLSILFASIIAKKIHKKFIEQTKINGELLGHVEEYVGGQKIVKSFGYEDNAIEKYEEINSRLYKCGVKAQIFSAYINPCTRFINSIVYAFVGVIGAIIVFKSSKGEFDKFFITSVFTVGNLTCFLSYASQYTKPFNEISGVINEIQSALAGAKRVFDLLDEEDAVNEGTKEIKAKGNVTFDDVSFSYKENQKLIENLNLKIKAGQNVAIVGPTGCGKTTLINLLMRFYEVDKGAILMDDIKVTDISKESLRSNFGMVLQDTWLFKGTVRDNICFGKENVSEEDMIKAAKMAHCHNFILQLPNGYDTVIGDDDSLSQGQKQLLCIARVMLLNPPILILDEATSNIDTLTEIKVQDAFKKLIEGRTSFVIAHRLSTIKSADLILVMKDGNIIETGTHKELLDKKGFYYNLYNSQFEN